MRLSSRILKLLRRDSYKPSTAEGIYKQLKEPHLPFDQFKKTLKILEAEKKISLINKKYVIVAKAADILNGRFEANKKGFGFVITPIGDVYIRSDKVCSALNKDLVEVRITRRRKQRNLEGVITKVLERSFTEIIGRVEIRDSNKWLIPADRRLHNMFLLNKKAVVENGQMVIADISKYPPKGEAILSTVLGDEHEVNIETEIIIRQHDLKLKFSKEAQLQADKLGDEVKESDIKDRKDYRDDLVVTIDGLDAKDFDDAISLVKKGDKFNLTVHIADVSTYVPEGSALDEEARTRGNSTYLTDRVLPMFPFRLSNGLASLNPDVDRLTLSVESVIDTNGDILSFEIHRGVMRSKARLTYKEVDEALKTQVFRNNEQKELFRNLKDLKQILEKKRLKKGSLVFETIEPKIILDKDLNPIDIDVRQRTEATAIIEELMIVTNTIVAEYMSRRKYPIIYRLHEEPAEDALEEISGLLKLFNYPIKDLSSVSPKTYQRIIKFASKRPDKLLINNVLIRSMQKARYSATEKHHFGLGLKYYCHFTSPIRRYADLVVHRQVKNLLDGKKITENELLGELQEIAENISYTETESQAAERESKDMMIARYMEDKIGEVYEAVVTGITNFGLFVQIPNSAEGLVHITSLGDDYYIFDAERYLVRGKRTGKVYRLGQKLEVELINVVVGERQLDFEIVQKKQNN